MAFVRGRQALIYDDVRRGWVCNGSRKIHMSETPRIERLWGVRPASARVPLLLSFRFSNLHF